MAKTLQFRRYPTSTLSSIAGANGEIIYDTTLKTLTVHDGTTAGGVILAKNSDVSNAVINITFSSTQANASFNQANYAFTQANAAFDKATASYIRANNSINANTGGVITGDLTVTGNLIITGATTTVNTVSVVTTDSLIKLANNNIFSDVLDIGFYGQANTGTSVTYHGLARIASSNNFLLFKGLTNDPATNSIATGSATAANVGTLIANVAAYSITSNTANLGGLTLSDNSIYSSLTNQDMIIGQSIATANLIINRVTNHTKDFNVVGNVSIGNTTTANAVTANSISISGNTSSGNIRVSSSISSNLITSNSISISGNTSSGNITVSSSISSNTVTSNNINISSNVAAGNVNVTGAIYQNGVITPTLITMLTYNLAF
jgi:autotransporter family porin